MKERKEDKLLKELFRRNLEAAEVIPSDVTGEELFRKLGWKEFLHFNAFRFNIWYAAAVAAATATVLIIFLAGSNENSPVIDRPADTIPEITDLPAQPALITENKDRGTNPLIISSGNKPVTLEMTSQPIQDPEPAAAAESEPAIPVRSDLKKTFNGKVLISRPGTDSGKLRHSATVPDLIKASVTKGCCPLKVSFSIGAESFEYCRWSFGDGGYSDEENPEWIFDVEGEYRVTLKTAFSGGSETLSSVLINVFPKPVARFEIADRKQAVADNSISFINYSTLADIFRWDFGDGSTSGLFEPVHIYRQPGNYNVSLIVTSAEGCSDTLTVLNAFTGNGNYINFPNAFLPNLNGPIGGHYSSSVDDAASIFHPVSSGVSEYQLRIFSKGGTLIFESNDINLGWDGYYKGQLCQSGVYIWKVRGNFINGEPFTKMGDLTLLKY